ncbi:MAG: bifunctional precorrin-2 dehydrogenase/sirohydrochlorin ferrochelatase [Candidatus Omnitrophica bacterium]|nr:bifunctional precorrin-2 dehydrogenase/sirohydrochlorin ferrochelatase [Candidatus Omnitrophota bacterium]
MKLYPVYLKLDAVSCLVVGGGMVAWRKVQALLLSGARVTVVSPGVCGGLRLLIRKQRVCYENSAYQKKFLAGKFLVIAATDHPEVNERIARDAGQRGMPVNVVDYPALCNFYVPSVMRKNGIMVSISTQGAFPGLAKKLRQEFQPVIGIYAKHLRRLALLRNEIKREIKDLRVRKRMLECLLDPEVIALIDKKRIRTLSDLIAHRTIR